MHRTISGSGKNPPEPTIKPTEPRLNPYADDTLLSSSRLGVPGGDSEWQRLA